MTPAKIGSVVLEALRRFWLVVVACVAVGIVAAVAAYTRNVPPLLTYRAIAVLGVAPVSAPGVTPPCTAAGIPTLVGTDVRLPAPGAAATPADLLPPRASRIAAAVETPTLVDVIAVSASADGARRDANDAATNIVTYCNARIASAFAAAVTGLDAQTAAQENTLAQLDGKTVDASARAATTGTIDKRLEALQAQHDALEDKWAAQVVVASAAERGLADVEPVAFDEIRTANARYAALLKQYTADAALSDLVASQYQPNAPRVIDLGARVATDRALLDQLRARLDVPENLMLSPTYAKAFAAAQSAGSDAAQLRAQVDLYDKRIAALKATVPKPADATVVRAAQRASTIAEKTYTSLAAQTAAVRAEQAALAAAPALTLAGASTPDTVVTLGERAALLFALGVVVLSLLLGIVLAVIALILDDRLITTAQITKLYAKPVIATLEPKGKS